MDLRLTLRGKLTQASIRSVLDPLTSIEEGKFPAVRVGLEGVSFVPPGPIVTLTSIIAIVGQQQTSQLVIGAPTDYDCRRYLATNGFFSALSGVAEFEGANDVLEIPPSDDCDTVLPLTKLSDTDDLPPLVRRVDNRLDELLGDGHLDWKSVKGAIRGTVREICDNIFQHAGGAPGWIAAQRYRNRRTTVPFLEIGISDTGRGIRRSLAGRFTELLKVSDSEAIERMLKERLTSREAAYRGTGYHVLRQATAELNGTFHLRSGSAVHEHSRTGVPHRIDGLVHWPGTHLCVSLSCKGATK